MHEQAQGWNTWDVGHLNAVVHLGAQLAFQLNLYDPEHATWRQSFGWRDGIGRLGPHAPDGSYCQLELRWGDVLLAVEYASEGERLVVQVTPRQASTLLLAPVVRPPWQAKAMPLEAPYRDGSGQVWRLSCTQNGNPLTVDEPGTLVALSEPLLFELRPASLFADSSPQSLLAQQRANYEAAGLRSGGWLADAAAGLSRVVAWNTIWEPQGGRVCTPVSRDWCRDYNGFGPHVLFCWDTFFCALLAALESPALARANLRAILQEATPEGFIPNFGSANGASLDRSQPPVGAYCVLKLLTAGTLDHPFVAEVYPALLRWHRWWLPNRDGNGDGLLEWGSNPPSPGARDWESHNRQAAMYESGLDNSPMWDEVAFNPTTNTLELIDVGLNALYALDAWALSQLAALLGYMEEHDALLAEHSAFGAHINALLWNEAAGCYQNRHWDGRFSQHCSPTLLYPLLAGIVPPERATSMVQRLLAPEMLGGSPPLPSIARNDPAFAQQIYWRGRVWPPLNFLVYEGLRRAGFASEASALAQQSLALFLAEWQHEGHVHENYNGSTGDGDDSRWSDPLYTWGALLAYIAIEELIAAEVGAGLSFGSSLPGVATLHSVHMAGKQLAINSGPDGLQVFDGAKTLLAVDRPARIRGYQVRPNQLAFQVSLFATQPSAMVTIGGLPAQQLIAINVDQQRWVMQSSAEGQVKMVIHTSATIQLEWDSEGSTVHQSTLPLSYS
jgi:putative isomerase